MTDQTPDPKPASDPASMEKRADITPDTDSDDILEVKPPKTS